MKTSAQINYNEWMDALQAYRQTKVDPIPKGGLTVAEAAAKMNLTPEHFRKKVAPVLIAQGRISVTACRGRSKNGANMVTNYYVLCPKKSKK